MRNRIFARIGSDIGYYRLYGYYSYTVRSNDRSFSTFIVKTSTVTRFGSLYTGNSPTRISVKNDNFAATGYVSREFGARRFSAKHVKVMEFTRTCTGRIVVRSRWLYWRNMYGLGGRGGKDGQCVSSKREENTAERTRTYLVTVREKTASRTKLEYIIRIISYRRTCATVNPPSFVENRLLLFIRKTLISKHVGTLHFLDKPLAAPFSRYV